MALYSRSEFAKLVGVKPQQIGVEITRGKIFEEKKKIDDTHKINKDYIRNRRVTSLVRKTKGYADMPRDATSEISDAEIIEEVQNRLSNAPQNLPTPIVSGPLTEEEKLYFDAVKREKVLKNEKLQAEIDYARIKAQKAAGDVIPTDLVKITFLQHNKSMAVAYKTFIEKLINIFAASHDITKEKVAEMRKKMLEELNNCIKTNAVTTDKNIENIVEEYSMSRKRGEHD